jgi:acetyl-CoA carboxylase biotin carboxyl carrier protein
MDELRELIALIRENGLAEFELEQHGFRVRLRREETYRRDEAGGSEFTPPPIELPQTRLVERNPGAMASGGAASLPVHPGAMAETAASEDQDLHIIPSPIVGTFYRAPSPTAEAFVKIGSTVEPETVVCIIEAMKLMNEIQAETIGEVVKIYVENGQPVEYGQPLFGIKK